MYGLRVSDGRRVWAYRTGGAVTSGIAAVGGMVYAGSQDQSIYALRGLTGRRVLVVKTRVPEASRLPLPGCGHVPMTDDPDVVSRILLRGSGR